MAKSRVPSPSALPIPIVQNLALSGPVRSGSESHEEDTTPDLIPPAIRAPMSTNAAKRQ